jgi:16S rRNA (cytidine1402-2'-O)-methyltransferase
MTTGTLYVVSTPIGNLEDITLRALRILREVSVIACEDTRQTRKLLDHFDIRTAAISYHDHNEISRAVELIKRIQDGENIALVTDAGTPLVSDPGYRLVDAAVQSDVTIVPIPGASAVLGALAAAGLPTDEFRFCGFLPPKQGQRRKVLESLADETCTLVFYESPHRILEALEDVNAVMGARRMVLARELTKLHEEFIRGTAAEIGASLSERPAVKGEITLLIGKGEPVVDATPVPDAVAALEAQGVSRMDAIKQVARTRGLSKRDVYREVNE